ncbi:MAG: hypothetical protein ACYC4L_13315 [Chloroflexota bacterium]
MRQLAFLLGGKMVLEGLWGAFKPRAGVSIWRYYLRPYLPSSLNTTYNEYSRLSEGSLRYLGFWSLFTGLVLVALASLRGQDSVKWEHDLES